FAIIYLNDALIYSETLEEHHKNWFWNGHADWEDFKHPTPEIVERVPEYEVNEILDSRKIRQKLHYLVYWKGYDPNKRFWEPAKNVLDAQEAIRKFHRRYSKNKRCEEIGDNVIV
ncbi:40547_t:CDS:2, partial [Gigaspora margarita]